MPKQVIELNVKKGLNTGLEKRDLQLEEASRLQGVLINKDFGVVGPAKDLTAHTAGTADTGLVEGQSATNHGHNLFAFSHDMTSFAQKDILQNGITGQNSGSLWTVSGDVSKNDSDFTYSRSAGNGGYFEQSASDRAYAGLDSHAYVLKIKISEFRHTSGTATVLLVGGSGYFANADKTIFSTGVGSDNVGATYIGTHIVRFTSHSSASTGAFKVLINNFQNTTTLDPEMVIDSVECYPIPSNTGDDYLLLRTGNGQDEISSYHYSKDKWFGGILAQDNNGPQYVFWKVDGNVRISDASKYGDEVDYKNWIGHVNQVRFSNFGVDGFESINPTPSGAWEAFKTWYNVEQTSTGSVAGATNGNGEYIRVKIVTDSGGNPTVTVQSVSGAEVKYGGTGYEEGDFIRFTDPGSTSETCDVQVRSLQEAGHEMNRWICTEAQLVPPRYEFASTDQFELLDAVTTPSLLPDGKIQIGFLNDDANTGTWNTTGAEGTATAGSSGATLEDTSATFTASMVGNLISKTGYEGVIIGFTDANTITTSGTPNWTNLDDYGIREVIDLGMSWVYDGNQESLVTHVQSNYSFTAKDTSIKWTSIASNGYWDSDDLGRITGANIYWRKSNDDSPNWYHLYEIHLNKGGRISNESDFIKWRATGSLQDSSYGYRIFGKDGDDIYIRNPLQLETYESRNGFVSDPNNLLNISNENETPFGYSAVVVANRIAYIANVKYKNEFGQTRNFGDAIFKSMPNKFDTFPLDRRLEVSIQDGDEITALATYADRLLQYKKNKMELINISQEIEFLEDTYNFKGVCKSSAVCKTDYGIAWVNKYGCYLYNGKEVLNLVDIKGLKKIRSDDWFGSSNYSENMQIAYLPLTREILVHRSSIAEEDEGGGDVYVFNLIYQNWVKHDNLITPYSADTIYTTNLITDSNGDLIWSIEDGEVKTWQYTEYGTKFMQMNTSDIDFGAPSVRKKIYRVRISYNGQASNITVRYYINGSTSDLYNFEGVTDGKPNGVETMTPLEDTGVTNIWKHAELKPATSDANNIYSFRLVINGTPSSSVYPFKINDISIVYRAKTIK